MARYPRSEHACCGSQAAVALFSLFWLALANGIGMLLAAMLLWPGLNDLLAPYTYGRWMPLHMDWQLYGWCALPLLGLLLLRFADGLASSSRSVVSGLSLWSLALLVAGGSWLAGDVSGKLFLNWSGFGQAAFIGAQCGIWLILALAFKTRLQNRHELAERPSALLLKAGILIGLAAVPFAIVYTSSPEVYPPVDPDSGGATGHSLLASTLGLVLLMGLLPGIALGLKRSRGQEKRRGPDFAFWGAYVGSLVLYLSIEHGNASNHSANQILGLASLLIWPGLVALLWRSFAWDASSKLWRGCFLFWWAFVAIDGWLLFLPGILDTLKFTNALVAHSHLAMGGMVTSLNMIILIEMGSDSALRKLLSRRLPLLLWNGGCLLYVLVMTVQGWREGQDPSALFSFDGVTKAAYLTRLFAGALMLLPSLFWLARAAAVTFAQIRLKPSPEPAPLLDPTACETR